MSGSGSGTASRAGVPAGAVSICNEALSLLGANTITDFTDNTKEAGLVNQFYFSAIEQTLRDHDWSFAVKRSPELAELSGELEFGYSYHYQLPADSLRVISTDIIGAEYEIEGDALLTDETEVKVKYISRVTDVSRFDALFRRALILRLAADMAYALTKRRSKEEELILLYERALGKAKSKDIKEARNLSASPETGDSWIQARI
ncbi:MAG: hypothetical protein JRD68_09510 [Deltaproteobacteria bacterium]|nr:hypothetical protein [Deltaproteobacteria bacterium]